MRSREHVFECWSVAIHESSHRPPTVYAAAYLVDQARHVESAAAGAVDTFGAVITAAGTTLFGFSASIGAKPAWTLSLPGCNTDGGGGTYIGLEASDDGSLVGFFCPHNNGTGVTARVYGVEGQTGKAWKFDLGPGVQAGQGQVQVGGCGGGGISRWRLLELPWHQLIFMSALR